MNGRLFLAPRTEQCVCDIAMSPAQERSLTRAIKPDLVLKSHARDQMLIDQALSFDPITRHAFSRLGFVQQSDLAMAAGDTAPDPLEAFRETGKAKSCLGVTPVSLFLFKRTARNALVLNKILPARQVSACGGDMGGFRFSEQVFQPIRKPL